MRLLHLIVAAATVSPVVAHGGPMLNIVGGSRLPADLKTRRTYAARPAPRAARGSAPVEEPVAAKKRGELESRQSPDNRCGPGIGNCAAGECCSSAGWCGPRGSKEYCAAPDCQINFGSGCDGNQVPNGASTASIARPHVGNVPYGGLGIYNCVVNGDIAITFDDGPYTFTADLLDKFKAHNATATFFITGNNLGKGMINDPSTPWPGVIRRMVAEGHQIASHTWSHQNASQLSELQMRNQMIFNEIAFNDILGFFPTYMRPPYSICEAECQSILSSLGYHIVYFDLDTEGYLHDDPAQIQVSKNIWDTAINGANPATKSFLHIEHDLQRQVVYNLTDHILTSLKARGFRSVTLGECLGDPSQNWYRAGVGAVPTNTQSPSASTQLGGPGPTTSNAPPTPSPSLRVSVDGSCGNGVTCQGSQFGDCCSEYFFCGRTNAYCGAGCNPLFGSCSGGGPPEPPPPTSTLRVSVDGSCGNGVTCQGSEFGNCCSRNFFCGATSAYCGNGCNPQFGTCGTFPLPGGVLEVSTDGSCGNGVTCQGSEFGNCCSEHFFCGANTAYCGTGCRPEFGICN